MVADSATYRPLPYVNIIIKGSARGTSTDKSGVFALTVHPNDTLLFSFIGYRTLEFPARDWEPGVILLPEVATMLKSITVNASPLGDPYEHLFDEENMKLKSLHEGIPFYYSKDKKEKIMLARAKKESVRVKNYVNLLVNNDKVKNDLIKRHRLTENEYYDLLAQFNQKNYAIMYYLSDSELLSLIYRFYEANAPN